MSGPWGEQVKEKPKKPKTHGSGSSSLQDDDYFKKSRAGVEDLERMQREQERARREAEERSRREAEERNRREEERKRRDEERQRQNEERRRDEERERRREEERERRRGEERERQREEDREHRREEERERRREEDRDRRREEEREWRREHMRQEQEERRRWEEQERRKCSPTRPRSPRDDMKQFNDFMRRLEDNLPEENEKRHQREREQQMEWEREHEREKERREAEGYEEKKQAQVYDEKERQRQKWKKEWERNKSYDTPLHGAVHQATQDPSVGPHSWKNWNRPYDDLHYQGSKLRYDDPVKPKPKPAVAKATDVPQRWRAASEKKKTDEPEKKEKKSFLQKLFGSKNKEKQPVSEEAEESEADTIQKMLDRYKEAFPEEEPDAPLEEEGVQEVPIVEEDDLTEDPVPEDSESYEWPSDYEYQTLGSPIGFPQVHQGDDAKEEEPLDENLESSPVEDSQTKKPWGNQHEDWSVEPPVSFENLAEDDGDTKEKPWGGTEPPAAAECSSEEEEFEDPYKKEGWTNNLYEDESDCDFIGAQQEKARTQLEENLPYVDPEAKTLTQNDIASGKFSEKSKFLTPSGSTVSLNKKLGEGAFGKVFEGTVKNEETGDINEGNQIAIKVVEYKSNFDKSVVDPEIEITKKMGDAGFGAKYFGDEKIPNHKLLYMQKLGGSLEELQKSKPKGRFSLEEVNKVGKQLCQSLSHLHSMGMIHSDLKIDNVCTVHGSLDDVKIIDYGCAKEIVRNPSKPLSPHHVKIDEKHDTYDVGVTMVNMYTGVSSYERVPPKNPEQQFPEGTRQFVKNIVNCSEGEVPQKLIDTTLKLMDLDPDKRPTPKEALEMNLFD